MSALQNHLDLWLRRTFVTTAQAEAIGLTRGRLQYLGNKGIIDSETLPQFRGRPRIWNREQVTFWAEYDGTLPDEFSNSSGHWLCIRIAEKRGKASSTSTCLWIAEGVPRLPKTSDEGWRKPRRIRLKSPTGQKRIYVLESELDTIKGLIEKRDR